MTNDGPLFLVGFMATGKTTVGRIVAERLGWTFRDLDEAIVAAAAGQHASVAAIFAAEGEAGFRRRETEAVREAVGLRRTVIATGGGAACREPNLSLMLNGGRVVALAATPEEVLRRTGGAASGRPLLDGRADPLAAAAELLAAREPFYARAHQRIDTVGKTAGAVADEVIAVLGPGE